MCVQLHGDASFTGQGVVMESLGLRSIPTPTNLGCGGLTLWWFNFFNAIADLISIGNLPHFTSGGSVHLVVE